MKKVSLFIFFIIISLNSWIAAFSQNPNWKLSNDSMNLAILVLDYQTYQLEKGHFSIHKPCDNCDIDSLPFDIVYNPPTDFGDISFYYKETKEKLFTATIIWTGMGSIYSPNFNLSKNSINKIDSVIKQPISIQYFAYPLMFYPEQEYKIKADSAWNFVRDLNIIRDFAQYSYSIGIYLYPPKVGAGVEELLFSKWIIFIYRGKVKETEVNTSISNSDNLEIYQNNPNPFSRDTKIRYYISERSFVRLSIYDIYGSNISTILNEFQEPGEHTAVFYGGNCTAGAYIFRIQAGNETKNSLIIKIE